MRKSSWLACASWLAIACGTTAPSPAPSGSPPLRSFRDCPDCPRLIALPAGTFTMGSPEDERGRRPNEGPQPGVHIPAVAVGATEVTRGQYAAFIADTARPDDPGCFTHGDGSSATSIWDPSASWRRPTFEQTDDHPVVCVSWIDAGEYATWLSRKTGRTYRLPSDAEWEYAARAGTATPFYWGQSADRDCAHANGGDQSLVRALPLWVTAVQKDFQGGNPLARVVACDDGVAFTAPVGRFRPNAYGLYDMTGNVWEWVQDCKVHELPTDRRPILADPCPQKRDRGGSWDDYPDDLRIARRTSIAPETRRNDTGFRLVREL